MKLLAIDPGLDGAVVELDVQTCQIVAAHIAPTIREGRGARRAYNIPAMIALLDPTVIHLVIIEKAQPFPDQGVSSMFSAGYGYGLWVGILATLKVRRISVHPSVWRTAVVGRGGGKGAAIVKAQELFPALNLVAPGCRVPHSGIADAACMAWWGLSQLGERPGMLHAQRESR